MLQDAATMKRDINFARHVMEADFETKLQQKSIDLWVFPTCWHNYSEYSALL